MAFDSKLSRISRTFAAVGERREILDVNIEPHALRHQRELLIFPIHS